MAAFACILPSVVTFRISIMVCIRDYYSNYYCFNALFDCFASTPCLNSCCFYEQLSTLACIYFAVVFPKNVDYHRETPPAEYQTLLATLSVRAYVWIVPNWTLQQSLAISAERQVQ